MSPKFPSVFVAESPALLSLGKFLRRYPEERRRFAFPGSRFIITGMIRWTSRGETFASKLLRDFLRVPEDSRRLIYQRSWFQERLRNNIQSLRSLNIEAEIAFIGWIMIVETRFFYDEILSRKTCKNIFPWHLYDHSKDFDGYKSLVLNSIARIKWPVKITYRQAVTASKNTRRRKSARERVWIISIECRQIVVTSKAKVKGGYQ